MKILNGHLCEPVYNCCLDRSGKYVLTGADDGLIKCWSVDTGRLLYTLRGQRGAIAEMKVDIHNKYIAATDTGTQNEIRFSSISTGETVAVLKGHRKAINGMDFDVATGCLITVSEDGKAKVWHPSCWNEIAPGGGGIDNTTTTTTTGGGGGGGSGSSNNYNTTKSGDVDRGSTIWEQQQQQLNTNLALAQQMSSEALANNNSPLQFAELEHFLVDERKNKVLCDGK